MLIVTWLVQTDWRPGSETVQSRPREHLPGISCSWRLEKRDACEAGDQTRCCSVAPGPGAGDDGSLGWAALEQVTRDQTGQDCCSHCWSTEDTGTWAGEVVETFLKQTSGEVTDEKNIKYFNTLVNQGLRNQGGGKRKYRKEFRLCN